MKKVDYFGLSVVSVSKQELFRNIYELFNKRRCIITYLNAHTFNLLETHKGYCSTLKQFDLVLPDGTGIVLTSRLMGKPIIERLTFTHLIDDILFLIAKHKQKLFLLGSHESTLSKMKKKIKCTYPHIRRIRYHNGYFDSDREIVEEINNSQSDILLVGMGQPKQELFVIKNKYALNVPIIICVGGLFEFYSGNIKLCPSWIIQIHMEWFYRLLKEPSKLYKRNTLGIILFIIRFFIRYIGIRND